MKHGLLKVVTALMVVALAGACSGEDPLAPPGPPPPGPPPPPPPPPGSDASLGLAAFQKECGTCHASNDGFDLAFFSYTDTTIIRRAVKHVDTTTAHRIVTYIRSLSVPHVAQDVQLFQPGGRMAANDIAFATDLFGQDAWPANLSTAQLLAIDPRTVPVAIKLPEWSDEGSNLDWLADSAPPPALMSFNGNRAANAFAAYQANPSVGALDAVVQAIGEADHDPANPSAPCLFNSPTRVKYQTCFEVRRWTSSLIAQHMLRNGITSSVGVDAHKMWWAVGETARRAQQASRPAVISNATPNQIDWMYLGWMFEPGHHETFYLENLLSGEGLRRHATFVALRSQVAREVGSFGEHESIYDGLRNSAKHAPASWTAAVVTFSLNHILQRLNSGDKPVTAANKDFALTMIDAALTAAATKVSAAELSALTALAGQVKAKL